MSGWLKIREPSAVAEARRRARRIAAAMEFSPTLVEDVAIVTTEIAQNTLRHGGGGEILVASFGQGRLNRMFVVATDEGRGMTRVDRYLKDGISSKESPGTGLGAIKRLSDRFDVETARGSGTTIMAEFYAEGADNERNYDHAGFRLPYPGESACGDAVAVKGEGPVSCYMVCDGLGHGAKAADVADIMRATFLASQETDPSAVLSAMHDALTKTRGAVAACLRIDRSKNRLSYAATGNISTVLFQSGKAKRLAVRDGLLGGRKSTPHEEHFELRHDAVLLMHSDGLSTLRDLPERKGLLQRSAPIIAARLLCESSRRRDDASILVTRMTPARTF